jgi:hypothetical protein
MSGAKKGQRDDPADVALIEAGLYCQSPLIRYFPAQNPVYPVMCSCDSSNQGGHRARSVLLSVSQKQPNFASTPPKLGVRFEDDEIFGNRQSGGNFFTSLRSEEGFQEGVFTQLQLNLMLPHNDPRNHRSKVITDFFL